jgi:hypothetical protein
MDELNVGALPVCAGGELLGMITDRDITVRATALGMEPTQHSVKEVMTEQTRWCTEDQSAEEVMKQMGDGQIRRLPVLNAEREIVGIVSLGDLATRQGRHTDEVLRDVSWPLGTGASTRRAGAALNPAARCSRGHAARVHRLPTQLAKSRGPRDPRSRGWADPQWTMWRPTRTDFRRSMRRCTRPSDLASFPIGESCTLG